MTDGQRDTDAYLARIRKTIEASNRLVEQVGLRIRETDRMLEQQGLTREQVMAMHFSEAQMEAANAELKRRGLDPIEKWEHDGLTAPEEFSVGRPPSAAEYHTMASGPRLAAS